MDFQFIDDQFHTRDLGFIYDGELYVRGRTDDMLVVRGRNVWARDVEFGIECVSGIRAGACALVDRYGTRDLSLALVVEQSRNDVDFAATARAAAVTAGKIAGVTVDECVFLRRGRLPKTSSGKIQRNKCRTLLDADAEAILARIRL